MRLRDILSLPDGREKQVNRSGTLLFVGLLAALCSLCVGANFKAAALLPVEPAAHIAVPRVPAELNTVMERATQAVNSHRPETLAPLSVANYAGEFEWTASKEREWGGDVLAVPLSSNQLPVYLAVFHTWHSCESDGDHVHRLLRFGQGWKLGQEIPETDTLGIRIRDHQIQASMDIPHQTASFIDTIQVEHSQSGNGQSERPAFGLLRISEDYRLQSLQDADSGTDIPFQQAGGIIAFAPPSAADMRLTLRYSGKAAHRNGDYIHADEAMLNSYWYPHTARLPASLTVTATAPPGWTALAQGELVDTKLDANGATTTTWRNAIATSYFTLDMGRYRISTRLWHNHTLSVYLLDGKRQNSEALARESLDTLQNALDFYERNFSAFPYSRYAVVETKGPFEGALEAYSFATFGPQTLPEFIPHELSHTWWGGLLPCTYTRSMWNEAFANYSDNLYQRMSRRASDTNNHAAADTVKLLEARKHTAQTYDLVSVSHARDTENEQENAVGYGKGEQVLRMLEEEIGQAAMLRSMQLLIANHPNGEPADWPEFESAVRKATGEDKRWFFAQWIDQKGVPKVRLHDIALRRKGGETFVEGNILQEGDLYRLKLPVEIELKNGASVRQIVEIEEGETTFRIPIKSAPDRLRLDPEAIVPMAPAPTTPANTDPFTYDFN